MVGSAPSRDTGSVHAPCANSRRGREIPDPRHSAKPLSALGFWQYSLRKVPASPMKGRIVATLFALPFAAVGVWMLWSIGTALHDGWRMQSWAPTDARLLAAGYETRQGDDSDVYEAFARYAYTFDAQSFTGERVAISSGGDNIGDFQRDLGRRLANAMARGETVTAWVDPDEPSSAVLDRTLRWGLLGFKSIFLFVFGGIGFGLLFFVWRAPAEKDTSLPEYQASPWLVNDDWQTPTIRSNAKNAMWGAWAFALFWNLISAALPFLIYDEFVNKGNTLALVGLLFPLVGLGLLVWAVRRTLEWRRFGPTPVVLDPFPGSIGGHVGGTIDTNLPFDASNSFVLTLTSIYSYESGSGKNRSQREKALWQDELVAHAAHGPSGTRLTFRFDVPEGLEESDAEQSGDSYNLWRLNLRANIDGTDLDRDFDIPVYATAKTSQLLDARSVEASKNDYQTIVDAEIRKLVDIRSDGVGKRLVYPMGRNAWSNLAGFVIGSVFAAAGAFLIVKAGEMLMGVLFSGVGGLIALAAAYMLTRSLEVRQEGHTITSTRRVLGLPVLRREMQKSSFYRFEKQSGMQTQSGGKHVMYYKIVAIDRDANELLLGEGFRGESAADAAIRLLARELGLVADERARSDRRDAFDDALVNEF